MQLTRSFVDVALFFVLSSVTGADKKVSVKETVFDSAVADMQWLGGDARTVLVQTIKGRLYRSVNKGDSWNDITDSMTQVDGTSLTTAPMAFKVDQVILSPADRNIVLVAGTQRRHYLSLNAGATWKQLRQKSSVHTVIFHKTRPQWALLSTWTKSCDNKGLRSSKTAEDDGPCNHMLYATKDMGKTFSLVTSYVVQFSWGDAQQGQGDRIYLTHFRQKKGDQPKLTIWSQSVDLAYTDDFGNKLSRIVYRGNKFLVSHGFIFCAKLQDINSQNVNLMISSDGAKTFRQAQLPQALEEKSYTILDTSEGAVLLHVNHGSKEPFNVGNVYKSDKDGVRYTATLMNNVRGSSGDCEFDKILSLDGVYIANIKDVPQTEDAAAAQGKEGQEADRSDAAKEADELEDSASNTQVDRRHSSKSKGKDETIIRTVVTFDKGGVWSYLKPPKVDSLGKQIDCPADKCWLHLHGITNFHNYAPFYSTENAVGIIMGTGNVGASLRFEPDVTNTYISRDGGQTWHEAHKGAFIYEFGDHGGLVVMADDIRTTKQVVFSWNEGQSWYDFELSSFPVEVDNIVTEPNATSTQFLLYGTRGDAGVVYHLDFESLGQPLCKGVWAADSVSSDYETWMPTDGKSQESCMLGRQVTYTRRKQTSQCFNGESFERPVTKKNCACTEEDFECEMGFSRKVGSLECRFTDASAVTVPDTCTSSDFYYLPAHRKVVGDSCEGGWQPQKQAVPCPAGSKLSRGAMSVLGTVAILAILLAGVTHMSRSDKFKGFFHNVGMDSFGTVRYATIGAKAPETGMESVGSRFDSEFLEGDQDDYGDEAPKLMTYTNGGDRQSDRDRNSRDDRQARGVDTAAASVPRLQAPPGGAGRGGDDDVDLL